MNADKQRIRVRLGKRDAVFEIGLLQSAVQCGVGLIAHQAVHAARHARGHSRSAQHVVKQHGNLQVQFLFDKSGYADGTTVPAAVTCVQNHLRFFCCRGIRHLHDSIGARRANGAIQKIQRAEYDGKGKAVNGDEKSEAAAFRLTHRHSSRMILSLLYEVGRRLRT